MYNLHSKGFAPHLCYVLFLILLGKQLRAARVLLGWGQIDLAKRARVAIGTIRRMESFEGEVVSYTSTLSKVTGAMEKAGIEFLNNDRPGVRLSEVQAKAEPRNRGHLAEERRK